MSLRHTIRKRTIPPLGKLTARLNDDFGTNLYVTTTQGHYEFVGLVALSKDRLDEELRSMGFRWNPLAAWKTLRGTDHDEKGSWRYVNPYDEYYGLEPPPEAREYEVTWHHAHQLHLVLYEIDEDEGTTAVCAHHELAWDTYPSGHYRAHYLDAAFGVEMCRTMFDANDIPLDTNTTIGDILD